MTPYRVLILFGIFYVLTLVIKKDTVITERGLEIYYQMRITTHYDFWSWKEIVQVLREDQNHPQLVALHIGRGNRSKRLFFTRSDAKQIMVLARKKNPRAVVSEMPKPQNVKSRKK